MPVTTDHIGQVKIWIRRVPPAGSVEGIDISHYNFRQGGVYEIGRHLAELLILWGYAEPARRRDDRGQNGEAAAGRK